MQKMVAGNRNGGKPRSTIGEKITNIFGTITVLSKIGKKIHQFRKEIWAAMS